ncbi:MAG: hypothetical protein V4703_05960 [Actinomycetota bacterium]
MPPEVEGFLDGITLADVLMWIVAAGVIFAGVKWVIPLGRKVANFLDDVAGEPARPGVAARAGLMERVQRIEHEMFPNSGKSLRDQTNRMEEKLDRDNLRIGELADQLDEHITQSTQIIQSLKEKP